MPDALYAGEGPLHGLMKKLGMTPKDYQLQFGVSNNTFKSWKGWPLYDWPIRLLEWYGYAKACEAKLKELGVDPTSLWPRPEDRIHTQGRYPRKKGQLVVDWKTLDKKSPWDNFTMESQKKE